MAATGPVRHPHLMSDRGQRPGLPEQIEADSEPGPSTDEVLVAARRAVADAWAAVSQLVGTSWKKPHAAALVQKRDDGPPGTRSEATIWQSGLVGHLLAGLSAANARFRGPGALPDWLGSRVVSSVRFAESRTAPLSG